MQVCSIGFLIALIYISDIGIYMVDLVDHVAVNLTLMLVGALQAYTIAWVWGYQEISARTGSACAPASGSVFSRDCPAETERCLDRLSLGCSKCMMGFAPSVHSFQVCPCPQRRSGRAWRHGKEVKTR